MSTLRVGAMFRCPTEPEALAALARLFPDPALATRQLEQAAEQVLPAVR